MERVSKLLIKLPTPSQYCFLEGFENFWQTLEKDGLAVATEDARWMERVSKLLIKLPTPSQYCFLEAFGNF